MRRGHRGAGGPRIRGRACAEVPDRRHHAIGDVAQREVPARRANADIGAVIRIRRRSAIGADSGDREDLRIGGWIEQLRSVRVAGSGYDQRACLRRAGDGAPQRRVVARAAEAEIDDPGAGARLDGAARAVVGGEPGGVEHTLCDVVARAEPTDTQHAHRPDVHVPIHAGHADAGVPHSSDRAGDVQSVVA